MMDAQREGLSLKRLISTRGSYPGCRTRPNHGDPRTLLITAVWGGGGWIDARLFHVHGEKLHQLKV